MALNQQEIQELEILRAEESQFQELQNNQVVDQQNKQSELDVLLKEEEQWQQLQQKRQLEAQTGGLGQTIIEKTAKGITLGEIPRIQAAADIGLQSAIKRSGEQLLVDLQQRDPNFFQLQQGENESQRIQRIGQRLGEVEPSAVDAFLSSEGFGLPEPQTFEQSFQEQVERGQAQEEVRPITSGIAEFGGNIVTGLATAPLTPVHAIKGAGLAGGTLRTGASALIGAGFAGASRPEGEGPRDFDLEKRFEQAKTGALFGGTIGGATELIKPIVKLGKFLGKKALNVFTRVDDEVIDTYVQNFERLNNLSKKADTAEGINRLSTIKEIEKEIETFVAKLKNDVDNARLTKDEAITLLKDAKFDSSLKLSAAKRSLDFAFDGKLRSLEKSASLGDVAEDIQSGIGDLKNKVIGGSRAASDILAQNPEVTISTESIIRGMNKIASGLKVRGKVVGDSRSRAIRKIARKIEEFKQFGDDITAPELKQIIKTLDEDIELLVNRNEFLTAAQGADAKIRFQLSETIKDLFPEYKEAMVGVAKDTALLSNLNKNFKNVDSTLSKLRNITSPTNRTKKQLIEQLGDSIGVDYRDAISKTSKLKKLLASKEGKFSIKSKLDEFKEVERLEKVRAKPDSSAVTIAKKRLIIAEKKFKVVKSLEKDPRASVQAFIATQGKNQVQRNRKLFESLSKLSERDFVSAIEDVGILSKFKHDITRGSANINLWGAMTVGLATATTGGGVPAALLIGPLFGVIIDRFGPRLAKKIIDTAIKIKGLPTALKIDKITNNPTVRDFLKDELIKLGSIKRSKGNKQGK